MIVIGPARDLLAMFELRDGSVAAIHLNGWIVGVRGEVLHALDAERVVEHTRSKSRRRTYDAPCGAKVRIWTYPAPEGSRFGWASALWPPRLSTLRRGERCRVCWETTGRKRPSAYFPPAEAPA